MRVWRRSAAIAAMIGALCTVTSAHAQEDDAFEDEDSFGYGFELSGAAQFPVAAGFQGAIELPGRLQLYAGGGVVPSQFQSAVNRAFVSMDAYDPRIGDFVMQHIGDTRVLRAGGGWRPFAHHGFFFQAGYTQLRVTGSVDGQELISGFTEASGSSTTAAQTAFLSQLSLPSVSLTSTLHMAEAQAGWEWSLDSFFLRASVGGAMTFSASSELSFVYEDGTKSDLGPLGKLAEGYLNSALVKYARTPFVGLQLGYRVF